MVGIATLQADFRGLAALTVLILAALRHTGIPLASMAREMRYFVLLLVLVFIARALVTSPRLLLLDEPTASIDSRGQNEFYQLLKRLNTDVSIVVVSHDLLVISTYVKSVACVNRRLHYHQHAEITGDMLESMYPCTVEDVCPVELVTHGRLPHRVLKQHEE